MALHVPVKQVLAIHSAKELSEWEAYERFAGPIDSRWRDEQLAEINELLQRIYYVTLSANSKGGASNDDAPKHVVRPSEIHEDLQRRAARGEFD